MATRNNSSLLSFRGLGWNYPKWVSYDLTFLNTFTQATISHPGWKDKLGGADVGGAWAMDKLEHVVSPSFCKGGNINGPTYAAQTLGFTPQVMDKPTTNQMVVAGTHAISESAPTNPSFNMAQAIGEAREGFPKIIGSDLMKERTKYYKGIIHNSRGYRYSAPSRTGSALGGSSSEYLNYQFGWLPMVADLRKFAHSVRDHHKILEGYRKGSDQLIRRRLASPPRTNTQTATGAMILSPSYYADTFVQGTTTCTVEYKSWFSGAFVYHVPIPDSSWDKFQLWNSEAGKLLGLRLTPDTVWNLAPWTWMSDWFANTGDIMTNISNLGRDGLVMKWGYQMASSQRAIESHWMGQQTERFYVSPGSYSQVLSSKRRIPASPYGFGLTFDGLTTRQKAILAAIGITRVR